MKVVLDIHIEFDSIEDMLSFKEKMDESMKK